MAIRLEKRLKTNVKNTITDIDPIRDAGNDFPSFVLERFSHSFIKFLDDLREFVSVYFTIETDMKFYSDINDNIHKKSAIIDSYYVKYNEIYLTKCPSTVKNIVDKLYLLNYYQINAIFFIIATNNLFCLAAFKTSSLRSLTEKITAQMIIHKYGNEMQKQKYLNNFCNFQILIEENHSSIDNILNTSTCIKKSDNSATPEIILKGQKKNVGIDVCNSSNNVLIIFVKDSDKKSTASLKQSFTFIIVDMNESFENKIQKIKCYSTLTMDYYHLKFNSIALDNSSPVVLSKTNFDGLEILDYQLYLKQVLFNTGLLSQAQQVINYMLEKADDHYTITLAPPKATKLIKADHFKSKIGQLYSALKQQIYVNFATCSDLKNFTNENTNGNFAVTKLAVPQSCSQIFDWAFSLMESDIHLSENCKFYNTKVMLQKYQLEDSSSENLTFGIGKKKVSGFLRIKRGLNTFKSILTQQDDSVEAKENKIQSLSGRSKDERAFSAGLKSAVSEILSSRGSLLSAGNSTSYSHRPLTPGNNMY